MHIFCIKCAHCMLSAHEHREHVQKCFPPIHTAEDGMEVLPDPRTGEIIDTAYLLEPPNQESTVSFPGGLEIPVMKCDW